MARLHNKLTALKVAKLSKPGLYCDGDGLWLEVAPGGGKSWVFRYTITRRRYHMGLGSLREVSLAAAREKALECNRRVRDGGNPLDERRSERATAHLRLIRETSFDACARAYIDAHRASWRNVKHIQQWENTLFQYASPVFGSLPVDQIDTALVLKALTPIWTVKTETATRLRGRIEAVLNWATVSKLRSGDNPARWRGHLAILLANPSKVAPVRHHPALPWADAPAFMRELRQRAGMGARALEYTIYTVARSNETRGMAWPELDRQQRLWIVPEERMKAGRVHRVPLSTISLELLEGLDQTSNLVFPGPYGGMLSDMSLTAVLRRMGCGQITVHGFRSTFRDWCSEYPPNAFPSEVYELALAHKIPDKTEAAYRRGELLAKRRKLMEAWARFLRTGL